VRFLRRRRRLRTLSERDCYARLHGGRTDGLRVLPSEIDGGRVAPPTNGDGDLPSTVAPQGPTDEAPALHLLVRYPRGGTTLTGEELRLELLRRMESRPRRGG
jgi:hypothetical protein